VTGLEAALRRISVVLEGISLPVARVGALIVLELLARAPDRPQDRAVAAVSVGDIPVESGGLDTQMRDVVLDALSSHSEVQAELARTRSARTTRAVAGSKETR
jgi:hypothetical protein